MTLKDKAAQYESLKLDHSNLSLVIYDLINHKFDVGMRVKLADYEAGLNGSLRVRCSFRAMPLFLIEVPVGIRTDPFVMTEEQVERMEPHTGFAKAVKFAAAELIIRHQRKLAAA